MKSALRSLLVASVSARADEVQIDFDFSGSTLTIGGALVIPPDGSITSSTGSITFQAAGTSGSGLVTGGAATLSNFVLDATVSETLDLAELVARAMQ